jgi:hypothetical protein
MELAPYNPSFLDMRNAILVADQSRDDGDEQATIWKVFASRGMGFSAGSLGGNDTSPAASFDLPPSNITTRTITGTVTDGDTHEPVAGATVTLAFQGAGTANPSTTTDPDGHYTLTDIPEGTYAKLLVLSPTYQEQEPVTVGASGAVVDFAPRFDWASRHNGGLVAGFTGTDYSDFGCGPDAAIDGSQVHGWSTNVGHGVKADPTSSFEPKQITISLPRALHVADFAVDPAAICGDDPSSATKAFRIETSTDLTSWVPAAAGALAASDNGTLTVVHPTGGTSGVQYVRLWTDSNQTPDFSSTCPSGGVSGCRFTDLAEIAVYGTPAAP